MTRSTIVALIAVVSAVLAYQSLASPGPSSSTTSTATAAVRPAPAHSAPARSAPVRTAPAHPAPGVPGAAGLDPDLRAAFDRAAADAAAAGIRLGINSGRRSPEHQAQLLRDAIATYGSAEEAARWVATPETSPHVSGDAIDVGPAEAAGWLGEHGAAYGLCRIYGNEPWHFELRPGAADAGCPAPYADPTHDPRMQR